MSTISASSPCTASASSSDNSSKTWHARLHLDYRLEQGRTVARHTHQGPLRILQNLYPEGGAICHNVLVHPPGGLVGGDVLDISAHVASGAHGLATTPGAARFYRSNGLPAVQRTRLALEPDARLEWLPLEALAYDGCHAENHLQLELARGAECLGWDVTAFGLPHAGQPFRRGRFLQHIEAPGQWLERGLVDAEDALLMDGALGLAGQRCMASLFFVAGSPIARARREAALDAARAIIDPHPLARWAGATHPNPQTVVVRALAPVVEPAMDLLKTLRAAWRTHFWQLPGTPPRIWSM
ncbi:MAG: urease accessory protein UreD [Acidovorax sp.]